MDAGFINLTPENLDGEHLCCIIRSKKAHPGVEAKRQWLADRLKEGHIFRKLNAKATVFIEYAPLETAWTPVLGDSYYYIYCLWVCGESKGKGYGRALMEYCLADARAKGKSGVCMLGTAFLDSANSASFSDDQSFIFGHHMDTGGGVFAPLLRYQKQEYFEKNPTFTLHTPGGCYTAWVFGAFVVQERAYPYVHEFTSADGMAAFVERVRAQSDIISPVEPAPGDRVLTLCTCTSKTNDLRYVVCAKLIPLA